MVSKLSSKRKVSKRSSKRKVSKRKVSKRKVSKRNGSKRGSKHHGSKRKVSKQKGSKQKLSKQRRHRKCSHSKCHKLNGGSHCMLASYSNLTKEKAKNCTNPSVFDALGADYKRFLSDKECQKDPSRKTEMDNIKSECMRIAGGQKPVVANPTYGTAGTQKKSPGLYGKKYLHNINGGSKRRSHKRVKKLRGGNPSAEAVNIRKSLDSAKNEGDIKKIYNIVSNAANQKLLSEFGAADWSSTVTTLQQLDSAKDMQRKTIIDDITKNQQNSPYKLTDLLGIRTAIISIGQKISTPPPLPEPRGKPAPAAPAARVVPAPSGQPYDKLKR